MLITDVIPISGLLRKKLNFDFVDNCDIDCDEDLAEDEEEEESNHSKRPKLNMSGASGDVGISSLQSTPNGTGFSPCRTRSGRIYINSSSSAEKPTSFAPRSLKNPECEKKQRLPTPTFTQPKPRSLNLLQRDLPSKNGSVSKPPPPLNYTKRPVSR